MAVINNMADLQRERRRLQRHAAQLEEGMQRDMRQLAQRAEPLKAALQGSKADMLTLGWTVSKFVVPFLISRWSQKFITRSAAASNPWIALAAGYLLNPKMLNVLMDKGASLWGKYKGRE